MIVTQNWKVRLGLHIAAEDCVGLMSFIGTVVRHFYHHIYQGISPVTLTRLSHETLLSIGGSIPWGAYSLSCRDVGFSRDGANAIPKLQCNV